ncbi:DUF4142 domain-containing protein [Streptomyces sp. NBC_00083]|uniref:DUF4142 domain-containing protein n=1 Tax=Streptomyces sp. NBC_00083 TaxID=2975647 RepID=UPI00225BA668|nr:DUF4142 domain-containing protein [Streptomyces sp. NBC_00083]MCX5387201.1 DUF4142 domain-containing protein [Streptomyces sp. NBC_00083]
MRFTHTCATAAAVTALALTGAAPAFAAASPSGSPSATADAVFLQAIHQANLAEIAAGKDARTHANGACVKQVADVIVRDHTTLDAKGAALAKSKSITLPNEPSTAQQKSLTALKPMNGTKQYDVAWLKVQSSGHQQALALIDKELKSGTDSQIKAAAKAARPIVAGHLKMVEGGVCRAPASASPSASPQR